MNARSGQIAHAALSGVLAPVLHVQASRTARRTPRLGPASGPDHGMVAGAGPAFRLVVIGESTAAGVGAVSHDEALPGFLARALTDRLQRTVTWSARGRRGATVRNVITGVVPTVDGTADLVVVAIGISDLVRRCPLERWSADVTELIVALQGSHRDARVLVAGMPAVRRFPAIPQPLRLVLGVRARAMDRVLRQVAVTHGATHVPMDASLARDPRLFASDGFHPSPAGYRRWAELLAEST